MKTAETIPIIMKQKSENSSGRGFYRFVFEKKKHENVKR